MGTDITQTTKTEQSQTDTPQRKMSTGKWQTVNGVRYPVGGLECEDPDEFWQYKSPFIHDGKMWETIKQITKEEALAIRNAGGFRLAQEETKDWAKATDEELMVASFGEGITSGETDLSEESIVVRMGDEKTQMPFGFVETSPFLELIWRKTGADCDGEEADLELPSGTYHILLKD